MKVIKKLSWDWKDQPDTDELKKKLKELGVHVYEDPEYEGSDQIAFIFSNVELTKEELESTSED